MANRIVSLVFLMLLSFYALSSANPEVKLLTEHYPPYVYEESGQLKGFSAQLVREAMNLAGIELVAETYPWARTFLLAKNSVPLITFPVARHADRDEYFHWIGKVATAEIWLYKLESREHIKVKSLDDARFLTLGAVRGGILNSYFESKGFKQLETVTDIEQGINMLQLGHIDLLGMDKFVMAHFRSIQPKEGARIVKSILVPELSRDAYIAASKSVPRTQVKALRETFNKLHESGRFQELEQQYLKDYP